MAAKSRRYGMVPAYTMLFRDRRCIFCRARYPAVQSYHPIHLKVWGRGVDYDMGIVSENKNNTIEDYDDIM